MFENVARGLPCPYYYQAASQPAGTASSRHRAEYSQAAWAACSSLVSRPFKGRRPAEAGRPASKFNAADAARRPLRSRMAASGSMLINNAGQWPTRRPSGRTVRERERPSRELDSRNLELKQGTPLTMSKTGYFVHLPKPLHWT